MLRRFHCADGTIDYLSDVFEAHALQEAQDNDLLLEGSQSL
ncbi:MAG: hypothetical protein OCU12_08130 [Methanophagales archaeon]|nr:hypothetical protein [Methanophagales archaeon]